MPFDDDETGASREAVSLDDDVALDPSDPGDSTVDDPEPATVTDEDAPVVVPKGEVEPEPLVPAPINPSSTPEQQERRTQFERLVNDQAEAFAQTARQAFIEARVVDPYAEVSISVKSDVIPDADDEADDDSSLDIAPETALALAVDEGVVPYVEWSKEELHDECEKRELPVSGTKDELIERLEASDAEDVAAAESDDE